MIINVCLTQTNFYQFTNFNTCIRVLKYVTMLEPENKTVWPTLALKLLSGILFS